MTLTTNQEQAVARKRLEDHLIRSHGDYLKELLEFIAPDVPAKVQNTRFGDDSISMTVRLPFRWPPLGDPGDYFGTVKARAQFRVGLRQHLSGPDTGRHLSNALFKELRAFTVLFTGGHRWGKRVLAGLKSVGEGRMAGRHSSNKIKKQEAYHIRRLAQMIQPTVTEISNRAKSFKLRGSILRTKILKDYGRDRYPWIRSLFPALENLHGKPTLSDLDPRTIRKLVTTIIQKETQRATGISHSLVSCPVNTLT